MERQVQTVSFAEFLRRLAKAAGLETLSDSEAESIRIALQIEYPQGFSDATILVALIDQAVAIYRNEGFVGMTRRHMGEALEADRPKGQAVLQIEHRAADQQKRELYNRLYLLTVECLVASTLS